VRGVVDVGRRHLSYRTSLKIGAASADVQPWTQRADVTEHRRSRPTNGWRPARRNSS
jgi:hypothetical protein